MISSPYSEKDVVLRSSHVSFLQEEAGRSSAREMAGVKQLQRRRGGREGISNIWPGRPPKKTKEEGERLKRRSLPPPPPSSFLASKRRVVGEKRGRQSEKGAGKTAAR